MATPESAESRRAGQLIIVAFAFSTVWFLGVFPPFSNPNELSRFQAVVSFVEAGTFEISGAIERLGDHEDKAAADGRVYSNKAPGLAFAAIPVYQALRLLLDPPSSGTSDLIFFLLRFLTVSTLCIVALIRFHARVAPFSGGAMVTLAVALGTPFLFYARSFFGHAWTAALLFLAWDQLKLAEARETRRGSWIHFVAAGFLAGWGAISEYTVALLALLLAIRACALRRGRSVPLFGAGACVPVALLLAYNTLCFGSPWVLSSAREAYPEYSALARSGLFGFGWPSLEVAANYLFHPARGLALFSPFWIWIVPGLIRWWRSGRDRADCLFVIASVVLFFLLLTAYPNWHGGWSLGNRYLLPLLFLAGLSLVHGLRSALSQTLFVAASVYSVASHLLFAATWPHFPPNLFWPSATGSFWFLARGWVAPNLFSPAVWLSLLPPAALAAAAALFALRSARPLSPRVPVAALLGLVPLLVLLLSEPRPSYEARLWRAAIYGAYSGRDPTREELRRAVLAASTSSERRHAAAVWRLYGPR